MKVKEKVGLKLNIQKTKIMASGPITSWQIDGNSMETVRDFIWGGSKITADCDCSHEFKRHLLLGRKVMTNVDSILKTRDITLPTKVHIVKAMVFSVVTYRCESWTTNKLSAEELILLNCGVGEDSWESIGLQEIKRVNPKRNQSWMCIGRTDAEAETLILGHLVGRTALLKAGREMNNRGWDGWMAPPIWWTWVWAGSRSWWWTGKPGMLQSMGSQRVGHNWRTELNWTELNSQWWDSQMAQW